VWTTCRAAFFLDFREKFARRKMERKYALVAYHNISALRSLLVDLEQGGRAQDAARPDLDFFRANYWAGHCRPTQNDRISFWKGWVRGAYKVR